MGQAGFEFGGVGGELADVGFGHCLCLCVSGCGGGHIYIYMCGWLVMVEGRERELATRRHEKAQKGNLFSSDSMEEVAQGAGEGEVVRTGNKTDRTDRI